MSIKIVNPGALTMVQDLGRTGYQQFGVPVSGCADAYSAKLANILVGNAQSEAVLECTMLGPQIAFEEDEVIAVTGGDLRPAIDGVEVNCGAAIAVKAGQTLSFRGLRIGLRCYIAFAGGMDIPEVMGSRATYLKAKIGGLEGRKLQAGDVIGLREAKGTLPNMAGRRVYNSFVPLLQYTIRVVLGPQDDYFTEEGIKTFLSNQYKVTPSHDRMGIRLDGPDVAAKDGYDIISDGIAMGAVQIAGGKPIIMLSDRQTTGGYTKIGNVITADFRILGQIKAGVNLKFQQVTVQEAQAALLMQRGQLEGLDRALNR